MANRFTKAIRQQIVQEFAVRHNGNFNPTLFFKEVKKVGPSHAAYDWFTWDVEKAALERQIEQARDFARDLRVSFRVEEVTGPHSVRVRETPMPMVLSPLDGRRHGGGYVLTDPDDPDHMEEHRKQAARTLQQWLTRYAAALADAKVKASDVEGIIGKLEGPAPKRKRAQIAASAQASA